MDLLDFIVLVLAASAVVDVWHNGSIFALPRAYLQAYEDANTPDDGVSVPFWAQLKLCGAQLLNCPYCFSHHTPWVLAVLLYLPALVLSLLEWPILALCLKIPLYSLAATRLGTLVDMLLPEHAKYRRDEFLNTAEEEDDAANT